MMRSKMVRLCSISTVIALGMLAVGCEDNPIAVDTVNDCDRNAYFTSGTKWSSHYGTNSDWDWRTIRTAADVNGDGRADVIGFGLDDVELSLSTEGAFGNPALWNAPYSYHEGWGSITRRYVADVNGDGYGDIVALGKVYVYVSFNNKHGDFFDPVESISRFGFSDGWDERTELCVADVNGDKKADIIGFGLQDVTVSLSTGTGFASPKTWVKGNYCYNQGWDSRTVRTVADVNNDGKADIVGFGLQDVAVSFSTGSAFSVPLAWMKGNYCYNQGWDGRTVRVVADVNRDGKADIVGFGLRDVAVSLSTGYGFDSPSVWVRGQYCYNQGWDENTVRMIADVNNDQKGDVVAFGFNGVHISLAY